MSHVLLAVRDLFFRVKLEDGLRRLGVAHKSAGRDPVSEAAADPPGLVFLDLSDAALDPLGTLRALRSRRETAGVPVVGFAPHSDTSVRTAAREAGCTVVVSRSRVSGALPDVLAPFRKGLEIRRGTSREQGDR